MTAPDESKAGKVTAVPHPMRPILKCRDGLAFCLACIGRQVGMAEQVALLLADVYGMSDQESAGRLRMPLPAFGRLLGRARNRMHQCAGGRCALVAIFPASAPDGIPDDADPGAPFAKDSEGAPAQLIGGEFDEDKLRTLRRELLNGLCI